MAVKDVLVLRALGLGDLLTAVPAVRALRRECPRARLRLATAIGLRDLVRLIGGVDDIVPTVGLRAMAYCDRPDLAVNLHGRGPQSTELLRRTDPRALWCHRDPDIGADGPEWDESLHEVDRWCRLLGWHGVVADPTDLRIRPPRTAPIEGAIVVHPGAGSAARRWPAARFGAVIRELVAGYGGAVVVTGGPGERALVDAVCRAVGPGVPIRRAVPCRLAELAAVVAHARLVLCGDTGTAHLATAFAVPSVVLFGPTPPAQWGPRIDARLHTVLWAGRRGDPHATRLDPGLDRIGEGRVVAAASAQLGG
ncbi:glycosyltransferase family 9 protein [Rhodococcus sp. SGAir0479]|uniref:glycosyltransferase family 9 protein n=1 Tax=Rhodococcus sp. SGAir0479 TaxID=2567884 RepID=UPI0010CCCE63|nr:glycosyltransferase family 9 protein [Rhodococcus sp. SGAir0479]QCQ91336.1 glycosyltransferase family 9 protein [Rhodococcus sp. SGAir0479]